MQATYSVFLAVLAKATPNPLIKASDEEGGQGRQGRRTSRRRTRRTRTEEGGRSRPSIDFDGIEARIVALPIPAGNLSNLEAGEEGKVYYVRRVGMIPGKPGEAFAGTPSLRPVRPEGPQGGDARREGRPVPPLGRPQEGALPLKDEPGGSPSAGKFAAGQGQAAGRRDLGPGRPPGRVGADLPRGLADQPRLLLRPGTCTAPTGRRSARSTSRSCPRSRPATTSTA